MGIDFEMILDLIMELVGNCGQNEDHAETTDRIKKFRLRERFAARRALAKRGFRGQELREAMNLIESEIERTPYDELEAFVSTCCDDPIHEHVHN